MLRYVALRVARRITIVAAAWGAFASGTVGCSGERQQPPPPTVPAAPAASSVEAVPSPLHVDRSLLLSAAPELTAESAAVLERSAPGASIQVIARTSLLEASRGFARLSPEELRALGAVFERAYRGLAPAEREQLEAYLQGLRNGRVAEASVEKAARQTFNRAIADLGAADRTALQTLYAQAIGKSLAASQQARLPPLPAVRVAAATVAAPVSVASPDPRTTFIVQPGGGVGVPHPETRSPAEPESVDADTLGRERATGHRNAIKAAEDRLKAAEAKLKWAEEHWHFVNSHTNDSYPLAEARNTLANAQKDHAAAKESLDAVEERARKAGMLPGWLR